jgi:endonuclease/exonuclease/phosphatase family metal-dependent hydrolase
LSHWTRSKLRKEQAQYICRQLEEAAPPYLLLGDFNDLPGSPMHRKLSAMMVDAFAAVGAGRRGTHRVLPFLPALRIDYLFASRDLILERARVAATHASDHHALVVELRVAHVRPSEYDLAQLKNA